LFGGLPANKSQLRLDVPSFATVQSRMNVVNQAIFVERFAQETNRSRLQRSGPDSLLRKGRDEDDRRAVALRDQTPLQLDPAQARHLHIRDQTRRVIYMVRLQEIFSRRKRSGTVPERSYKSFCCFTNGRIIIDD
jgi:hypothetical protein